jgi:hypothetical protein
MMPFYLFFGNQQQFNSNLRKSRAAKHAAKTIVQIGHDDRVANF